MRYQQAALGCLPLSSLRYDWEDINSLRVEIFRLSALEPSVKSKEIRYHQLDALRGLAAMTVVLLHFRNLFLSDEATASLSPWQHFFLYLSYPITTGTEAVVLFFVLSGFVLMLPYIKGTNQTWGIFVIRRILRIYGPYLWALLLAIGGAAIWHGPHGLTAWGNDIWSQPVALPLVMQHLLMIGIYDFHQYNPVFWTLVEEMRISLVYPVLAYMVLKFPAKYSLLLAIFLALFARGFLRVYSHSSWILTLEYMGMFLCGMVLARNFAVVSQWYRSRSTSLRALLVILSVVFYFGGHRRPHGSLWFMTIGSLIFIVLSLSSQRAGAFLSYRAPVYLGRISYSLYLIHIPVLFALAITLHHKISWWLILPLYVCTSIALASIFYLLVERPFTQLSRRVARVKVLVA